VKISEKFTIVPTWETYTPVHTDELIIDLFLPKSMSYKSRLLIVSLMPSTVSPRKLLIGRYEEWATAWKKYYHPVKISEKFTIVPTWETYTPVHTVPTSIIRSPFWTIRSSAWMHKTVVGCVPVPNAIRCWKRASECEIEQSEWYGRSEAEQFVRRHHGRTRFFYFLFFLADNAWSNKMASVFEQIVRLWCKAENSGIIGQKKQEVKEALEKAGFTITEILSMEDWVSIIASLYGGRLPPWFENQEFRPSPASWAR
jgi:ribosomal protein L11 methylase PrmA